MSTLQCPEESLQAYVTTDGLPFVHFVLRELSQNIQTERVVIFLHEVPEIEQLCRVKNRDDQTAGQAFPTQAHEILCAACRWGSVPVVNGMLAASAQVDRFDDKAMSPLMWAANHGHMHIIQTLIHKHKASIGHCNINNENSLLTACKSKQWGAAWVLFDCGVDALCRDKEQNSALRVAIRSHAVDLLQHMAAEKYGILKELRKTISLSDVCKFGYDRLLKSHNTDSLPLQELHNLLGKACSNKQIQILDHFSQKLDGESLSKLITDAYKANHYDCMDVFVQSAQNRSVQLSCPEIHLSEICEHPKCVNLIKYLIENGQDVNEGKGKPLRMAVKSNNVEAVQCLLRSQAKTDMVDESGSTPLLQACQNKNLEIVDALLLWGADVNFSGKETPLTIACKGGSTEVVDRLLSNKTTPDLNKQSSQGKTPFEVAIDNNNFVVAVALLKRRASPSFRHVSLEKVCQIGETDLVNEYLQSCSTSQDIDSKILDSLVKRGNVELVNFILKNTKVTKTFEPLVQALKTACTVGTLDIVKVLIKYLEDRFKQSVNDPIYLQLALEHCHKDIVDFLIDRKCDLLAENIPWKAVIRSKEILNLLMECDIPQTSLNQALMHACRSDGRTDEYCVRLFLDERNKKRANVNHRESDNVTPLLIAIQKSSVSLVKLLLEKGADPNHCDINKNSPLFIACELENREIVSHLFYDGKADLNFPSVPFEKYPLWEACMKGHLDIAEFLLENGASPDLCDEEGHHLLFKAHSNGQHETVRLMLEYKADPHPLSSVTLKEACQYGYAEYALQNYSDSDKLVECLKVASKHGFIETALGIIVDMKDHAKQLHCFMACQDVTQTSIDKVPTIDTTTTTISSQEGNPLWQCYNDNDTDEMVKLLKDECNPNIKNTYGRPLLHLWLERKNRRAVHALCECPKLDITQTDKLGRNALFYALDWCVHIPETCMYDYLKAKGAQVVPDKFGRTILHEWKEYKDGLKRGLSLEKFLEDIPTIDICDHKNQTPLHVAIFQSNSSKVCKLLELDSNPKAEDVNGISPVRLACENPEIYEIFIKICPDIKPCPPVPQMHDDIEKVYLSKDYPIEQKLTFAIHKLFSSRNTFLNKTSQDSVSLFKSQLEKSLLRAPQFKREFKDFKQSVLKFMTNLGDAIGQDDPLFKFSPTMSGSCSEATKVIEMDEADILCVFQHPDWETLLLEPHEEDNLSFVKLEKSERWSQRQAQLFKGTVLSAHRLFKQFYTLVRNHAAHAIKDCKNLYIMNVHTILPNDCSICPMELVWSGQLLSWQKFSVDIVPAVLVSKEKVPKGVKYYDFMHDVVVVPKWTSSLIPKSYADQAFQLGFSVTEKDFFYGMPVALREAYKLAKVVKHNCMVIDDVKAGDSLSSYMLKCKAFECFAEMPGFEGKVKNTTKRELIDDEASPPDEVLKWADKLLAKVECNVKHGCLKSFFLGYNLLHQANYRSLIYARLCRAMLHIPSENVRPYTQLAETVADQLVTPQNLDPDTFVQEVNMLLEMNLHVNYRPKDTATILSYMIKNNLLDGVKILLKKKASVDDIDGKGSTAMQVAEENKCTDILHHLQENVAGKIFL